MNPSDDQNLNLAAKVNIYNYVSIDIQDSISVPINGKTIYKGHTLSLSAVSSPTEFPNLDVSWSSNNTAKASVNELGVVTGVDIGEAVITSSSVDPVGLSDSFTLSVISNVQSMDIQIEYTSITTLKMDIIDDSGANSTQILTAVVTPLQIPFSDTVTWASDDPSVATVSSLGSLTGLLSAVELGKTTITATSVHDGTKKASIAIEVVAKDNSVFFGTGF